jgi:hypothetical protein
MQLSSRLVLALVASFALACATNVSRMDTDEVIDLSGEWNDSDSQIVAREMIQDAFTARWLDEFDERGLGRRPIIVSGEVRNRSNRHINTETFIRDIQRAAVNSGVADFIAGPEARNLIRREREQQVGTTQESMRSEQGQELGADYLLTGTFNVIEDSEGRQRAIFYQVNLELIDMRNNRKVWIGDKRIRKLVARPRMRL